MIKKLLGILVICSLLGGNVSAGVVIDYKKKFKADQDE